MTKMTISDIDAFNAEASQFVPEKVKKTRVVKPVAPGDLCVALKKDGNACCNKKKVGDLCGRHFKKPLKSSVSKEFVSDSGSESCGECQSCEVKTSIKVDLEDGSSVSACETCIEAGAIENLDYDSL